MKLSPALESAFNEQIHLEFESVYAYLQMAADLDAQSWSGFSTWMHGQSQEEWMHANKFTQFVLQRGNQVQLRGIGDPAAGLGSPLAAFERALEHERKVSQAIHALYAKAVAENDYASLPLLQWFVNEQVEEEDTVGRIVDRLRLVGNDNTGLMILDRELGQRPAASAAGPAA